MECAMNGTQRRRKLLDMMRQASTPLSGGALGRETGVSRQVVVQDIALLRTMGYPIPVSYTHLRREYPDLAVVCYINSTAEIKSWSDVCVTSANAVQIVRNLPNRDIL